MQQPVPRRYTAMATNINDKYFSTVEENVPFSSKVFTIDHIISHSTGVALRMEALGAKKLALLAWTEVFLARAHKDGINS